MVYMTVSASMMLLMLILGIKPMRPGITSE